MLHPWKVNIKKAIEIQEGLRKRIILKQILKPIEKLAAVDVAFFDDEAKAVVCIFNIVDLRLIETKAARGKIGFPYVPGLLTFREGPLILKAFKKIKTRPDIVLLDGQGVCHPRHMGIATHLGILLDLPSIGCAKSSLYGIYKMPANERGSYSFIRDKDTDEILGIALRTRTGVKPVFISCGYKIDLDKAKGLILELTPKFRIPEPLRWAHRLAKESEID